MTFRRPLIVGFVAGAVTTAVLCAAGLVLAYRLYQSEDEEVSSARPTFRSAAGGEAVLEAGAIGLSELEIAVTVYLEPKASSDRAPRPHGQIAEGMTRPCLAQANVAGLAVGGRRAGVIVAAGPHRAALGGEFGALGHDHLTALAGTATGVGDGVALEGAVEGLIAEKRTAVGVDLAHGSDVADPDRLAPIIDAHVASTDLCAPDLTLAGLPGQAPAAMHVRIA
jgi:hypothetical protein